MTILEKIEKLDEEMKEMNLPFDKGLPYLQEKLWAIADEHNTTGDDVFKQYMNWKSTKTKEKC